MPEQETSFYGDRVQYFDEGVVDHSFIEKDQRRYYRRWPERKFTFVEDPEIIRVTEKAATVRWRLHYDLHRGEVSATGVTENVLQLERRPEGFKIVAITERKLPR